MVSSVSNSAVFSAAMLSGSQGRRSGDTEALKEKLFTKLDANGDGGIDKSELGDFVSFAASANGVGETDSAGLFSSIDADGDGAISQSELSDGTKKLFEELRTQLMISIDKATEQTPVEKPDEEELFSKIDANGDGSIDQDELGSFMEANEAPRPQRFQKIELLLDQYRSTATADAEAATETFSLLSIAA